MEAAVCDVENSIKESENAKIDSENQLSSIEESMNHLSEEVDNILKQSNENAILVGKRIESDTQHSIELIKESTQKTIENNLNTLKNDIIRRASLASVEVAKSHIIEELKRNPDLHDRLINESIEAIEGTEI
jgi:F0F1-type ATP synthase membrane subunit b/b'